MTQIFEHGLERIFMGKRFVTIISLLAALCQIVHAQDFTISNKAANVAILAYQNKIVAMAEGIPCDSIVLRTDNGVVKPDHEMTVNSGCHFLFIPASYGQAHLSVYRLDGQDTVLVGTQRFTVRYWPRPEARLGAKYLGGSMSRGEFKAQGGIGAPITGTDICGYFEILGYTIRWIRNGECYREAYNEGARYSDENQDWINRVEVGDMVHYTDIKVKMPGETYPVGLNEIFINIKP